MTGTPEPQLDLTFAAGPDGRAWLSQSFARYPWSLSRAHYDDAEPPGLATAIPQSVASALLAGDRIRQRIRVRKGAAAHVASQGAVPVHAARAGGVAETVWRIDVEAGGFLEVVTDPYVLFADAALRQRVELRAAPESMLVYADGFTWRPQPAAPAFLRFDSEVVIRVPDGDVLAIERFDIGALDLDRELRAASGPLAAFGQVLAVTRPEPDLGCALRTAIADVSGAFCGVASLPNGAGWAVRIAARDAIGLAAAQRSAWCAARRWRWGVAPPDRRRGL